MQGMVPLKKQSKKKQREFWERQRGDWQGLCPVTRIVPNKKTYQRKKRPAASPPGRGLAG